jgi:glycyl-tRNA synthetase beta chain
MNSFITPKGDLLLEFFSEEIPARMQFDSEKQLEHLFKSSLLSRDINFETCSLYSGPRHLSIIINNIELIQKDKKIEIRGPRVGSNEKAITGFLQSQKISMSDLVIKKLEKGEFYFFTYTQKGIQLSEILPTIIEEIVKGFVWPKSQRWSTTTFKWARPLRNILLLLDNKIVEGRIDLGNDNFLTFNNFTYSHRHYNEKIIINNISDYETVLKKHYVLLSRNKRKQKIIEDFNAFLKTKEIKIIQDETLFNEVLGLAEYPNVLVGSISSEFMNLPREVLSTAMRVHQKYFSVVDEKNKLLPKFLFVSNSIPKQERDNTIIEGNERVLKARLSDAKFFWETDKANSFEIWNDKLKDVQFHEGLGSIYEKIIRMSKMTLFFSKLFNVDQDLAKDAVLLSKSDLVSEMVGEFPELQGIMGGYYSKLKGKPGEVSEAIFDHYKPKGLLDSLPRTKLGSLLSIIDKIDTLTGFFIIKKQPTGSKDPFALRRTGFSIVQIMISHKLDISINDIFVQSLNTYQNYSELVQKSLNEFIVDKIKFILNKEKLSIPVLDSVLSIKDSYDIALPILLKRIHLLESLKEDEHFKTFLMSYKRIHNILKANKLPDYLTHKLNESLFLKNEEKLIFEITNVLEQKINKSLFNIEDQSLIIKEIVNLNQIIEVFFENVVVNDKDELIKFNRITLLEKLYNNITKFSLFHILED